MSVAHNEVAQFDLFWKPSSQSNNQYPAADTRQEEDFFFPVDTLQEFAEGFREKDLYHAWSLEMTKKYMCHVHEQLQKLAWSSKSNQSLNISEDSKNRVHMFSSGL